MRCEHCKGSGLADKQGPDDDALLDRVVLSALAIDEMRAENDRLRAALQAVMGEWREGYGLYCVEQVRAALGTPKEQKPDELPKNHRVTD